MAETLTASTHAALRAENIVPRTRVQGLEDGAAFPHVVFCAPPSARTPRTPRVRVAA